MEYDLNNDFFQKKGLFLCYDGQSGKLAKVQLHVSCNSKEHGNPKKLREKRSVSTRDTPKTELK